MAVKARNLQDRIARVFGRRFMRLASDFLRLRGYKYTVFEEPNLSNTVFRVPEMGHGLERAPFCDIRIRNPQFAVQKLTDYN